MRCYSFIILNMNHINRFQLLIPMLLMALEMHAQMLTPMVDTVVVRDGKKIPVDVYVPGPGTWPVILIQTPYNRLLFRGGLPLEVGIALSSSPYAFVVSDWRGFYGATAALSPGYDRGLDGYDIIQWITVQSFSNGRVAMWGPSALGKIQYETARHHPPGLVGMVPLVAGTQISYEEYYPGGAYRKEYVEQLDALGYGLSTIIEAHPTKDFFWTYTDTAFMYPEKINTPTLMIGGWYDHNVTAMLTLFDSLRTFAPTTNRDSIYLIMGPWAHGGHGSAGVGTVNQGSLLFPAAAGWPDSLANLFLQHYLLRSSSAWLSQPRVWSYQMGEHVWSGVSVLPKTSSDSITLYALQADSLGFTITSTATTAAFISDPRNPSLTIGGPTLRADLRQGPYDQTGVVTGGNGLVITSAPFSAPAEVLGRIRVHVPFACSSPDADICVRIADVDPADDSVYLLVDAVQRLRFRNGYLTMNDTLIPGMPYSVEILLPYTAHTFMPGHRIQLIVTGSNYPRFDLNLQNSDPLYSGGDTLVSTLTFPIHTTSGLQVTLPLRSGFTGSDDVYSNVSQINIFPNPVSETCFITGVVPAGVINITLTGMDGREHQVHWRQAGEGIHVTLDELPAGLYLIAVACLDGGVVFSKVIKE